MCPLERQGEAQEISKEKRKNERYFACIDYHLAYLLHEEATTEHEERSDFRMTLKNSFGKCTYLFYQPMDKKIKI